MPLAKDTNFCGWGTIIALSKSFIRNWTQTLVLIMLSIKATKWLSKLHGDKLAQIKQCLSIFVWTLKQLAGINTGLDINWTFSCKINVNYTAQFFATQSSYLTFHFRDYTSNCGALTLRMSQLVCNRFVTVKLKGLSKVLLMKMKPWSPQVTRIKNMNIKLDGEALRRKAITLSLQCCCFTDTPHAILIVT